MAHGSLPHPQPARHTAQEELQPTHGLEIQPKDKFQNPSIRQNNNNTTSVITSASATIALGESCTNGWTDGCVCLVRTICTMWCGAQDIFWGAWPVNFQSRNELISFSRPPYSNTTSNTTQATNNTFACTTCSNLTAAAAAADKSVGWSVGLPPQINSALLCPALLYSAQPTTATQRHNTHLPPLREMIGRLAAFHSSTSQAKPNQATAKPTSQKNRKRKGGREARQGRQRRQRSSELAGWLAGWLPTQHSLLEPPQTIRVYLNLKTNVAANTDR